MSDESAARAMVTPARKARGKRAGALKKTWQRIRKPIAQSTVVKQGLASVLAGALRVIRSTNRVAAGSHDIETAAAAHSPAIITLWHGQHLLAPAIMPKGMKVTAMFSRSADAEINALVAQRFGFEVVRGSGGREGKNRGKGGASALIALKRALDTGRNVAMIADVSHTRDRQAGLGIVTLARLSGRPIVPIAVVTSRRRVIERSWDKTTVNLPFGRSAVVIGEPIYIPSEADEAAMNEGRTAVTAGLDAATAEAYRIVDRAT